MLVLSRKVGEKIHIADNIVLTVIRVQGDKVRLGFEAPREIAIHRNEVLERILEADARARAAELRELSDSGGHIEQPTRAARPR